MQHNTTVLRKEETGNGFDEDEESENYDSASDSSSDFDPGIKNSTIHNFQRVWLSLHEWLKFDQVSGVMGCKYCVKFGSTTYKTNILNRHGNSIAHRKQKTSSTKKENGRKNMEYEAFNAFGKVDAGYSTPQKGLAGMEVNEEPAIWGKRLCVRNRVSPMPKKPRTQAYQQEHEFQLEEIEACHLLAPDTSSSEECEHFGRTVAAQLKTMNHTQKCVAQRLISEICFRGQLQILQLNTTLATAETTYQSPPPPPPQQQQQPGPYHGTFYLPRTSTPGFNGDMTHQQGT